MSEQIVQEINWQLDQRNFQRQVRAIISEAQKKGKVITLPIGVHLGQVMLDLMTLLLSQVNCDGCDAPCCRRNPSDEPISILPPEYERLAGKYEVGKLSKIEDGTYGLPMPCPFLKGGRCSIYSDRPLVCIIYPFQPGGADFNGNMHLALSSSCPESHRIARNVYMWGWRIRHQFWLLGGDNFIKAML